MAMIDWLARRHNTANFTTYHLIDNISGYVYTLASPFQKGDKIYSNVLGDNLLINDHPKEQEEECHHSTLSYYWIQGIVAMYRQRNLTTPGLGICLWFSGLCGLFCLTKTRTGAGTRKVIFNELIIFSCPYWSLIGQLNIWI